MPVVPMGAHMFLKRIFLLPVALLCFGHTEAQELCVHVLSGQVIDDHDRTPLAFAEIYLPELERGTVADVNGAYRLDGLCPGRLLLRVTHLGCEPVEVRVEMKDDKVLDLHLEHHVEELKELEIVRSRPDENVGRSVSDLDADALLRASGGSLAEVLSSINGVEILQSGPTISKPMIRGLSGNRVLVLNQGVRQEDQQWGSEHAPNLDPYSTERVSVVKGAASVAYGSDAIGGVVLTEPAPLPTTGGISGEVRTIANWNGRGGGINLRTEATVPGVKGLAWRLQGSGRYLGDARAPSYVLSNTGVREGAGSVMLGLQRQRQGGQLYYSYFTRELGILRASHIGNLTDLENAISSGTPWYTAPFSYEVDAPRQVVQHHLVKAETYFRTNELDQFVLTYAYQADDRQEYDIRRAGRSALPALDLFLTSHTADLAFKHFIGRRWHGKAGVSGLLQENYNVPGTGVRPLLPDHDKRSGGIYLVEHLQVAEDLELEGGARWEWTRLDVRTFDAEQRYITPRSEFINHALSLGGNWSVTDSLGIRFGINSAFRPPHVSELYSDGLHHGAAALEIGDPELGSERSLQSTLDLHGASIDGDWIVDLGLHASTITDFIQLRPDGFSLTIRGAFPVFRYESTGARIMGGDLAVTRRFSPGVSAELRGSIVRGRDVSRDEWLFLMPADRLRMGCILRPARTGAWRNVRLEINGSYIAEQTRVPVGLDFSTPPAGYALVGVSLSAERPLGNDLIAVGLRGDNLGNVRYRDYLDRFRYYADARGTDLTLWLRFTFG